MYTAKSVSRKGSVKIKQGPPTQSALSYEGEKTTVDWQVVRKNPVGQIIIPVPRPSTVGSVPGTRADHIANLCRLFRFRI